MTPRPLARTRRSALRAGVAAGLGVMILAGCDPRQALYFFQPFEPKIPAPGPALKGKRVVILTSAAAGTQDDFAAVDRELGRELGKLLKQKVKKLDLVPYDQVAAWSQAKPTVTDPADAARAFEADVVLFLEVREFRVQSPSDLNMLSGHASVHVRVVEWGHPKDDRGRPIADRPKESSIIYEADRDTDYPVTGHIPIETGVSRTTFRNKFLGLVAAEISWHFVEHAPGDNIQDTRLRGD